MREIRVGQVVQSTCGRDAGNFFLALEILEDQTVLVVDGKVHKLEKPKRKNPKHLRALTAVSEIMDHINYKDRQSQNALLRKELQRLGYSNAREG